MTENGAGLTKQIAMRKRTREFAVAVTRICDALPRTMSGRHIAGQLIRCSSSVASNYRAACRAKSRRDFISKIGIVLEEADEALFWLSFSNELGLAAGGEFQAALSEADQLVAIFTATRSTALKRQRLNKSAPP
jgi:four helix bundle protein